MISYAQNFEDVMLARAFKDKEVGFYIDVGAEDPVSDSVTKYFYDLGWSGINIEPDVRFYQKLAAERPRDINLCVALGAKEETRVFHHSSQHGISTFVKRFREHFEGNFIYEEQEVRVTTLASICREHVKSEIDFLKIDVEGWEGEVICGGDWNLYRPAVLVLEATEPTPYVPAWGEWEPLLLNYGYEFVYYDGLNRFYTRSDRQDLKQHFQYPPNVHDLFQTYGAVRTREDLDHIRAEWAAAQASVGEMRTALEQEKAQSELLAAEKSSQNRQIEELSGRCELLGREKTRERQRVAHHKFNAERERRRAEALSRKMQLQQEMFDQLSRESDWQRDRAEQLIRDHALYRQEFEQVLGGMALERRRAEQLANDWERERQRAIGLIGEIEREKEAQRRAEKLLQEAERERGSLAVLLEQAGREREEEQRRAGALLQEAERERGSLAVLLEQAGREREEERHQTLQILEGAQSRIEALVRDAEEEQRNAAITVDRLVNEREVACRQAEEATERCKASQERLEQVYLQSASVSAELAARQRQVDSEQSKVMMLSQERELLENESHLLRKKLENALKNLVMDPIPPLSREELEIQVNDSPRVATPGETITVGLTVCNRTDRVLLNALPHPIYISYRWKHSDSSEGLVYNERRMPITPLFKDIRQEYQLPVDCPRVPGSHILEIALVQERVRWLDSNTLQIRIELTESVGADPVSSPSKMEH